MTKFNIVAVKIDGTPPGAGGQPSPALTRPSQPPAASGLAVIALPARGADRVQAVGH